MPRQKSILKPITVYMTEKDVVKRVDFLFVRMLEGLVAMLKIWGDFECKGGGCLDPKEALFHCKACTIQGIKHHVDQAVERWKAR